jgi:hypothetical protein
MKKRGKLFSKSKRSQAGVMTAVLLVLIAIGSIGIVWVVVSNSVKSSTEKASPESLNIMLEVSQVKYWYNWSIEVDIKRGADEGELTELKFIFYNKNGDNKIISRMQNLPQKGKSIFFFTPLETGLIPEDIEKVSIVPVFGKNMGIEVFEDESSMKKNSQKDSQGKRLVYYSDDLRLSSTIGLTSWWKFDYNAKDSIGNHDTTIYNGAVIADKSLILDGVDDYAKNSLAVGPVFSVSVWVKPSSLTGFYNRIIENAYNQGFFLGTNLNRNTYKFMVNSQASPFGTAQGGTVVQDTWQHIAGTYDGAIGKLYVDGIEVGSGTFNPPAPAILLLYIGKNGITEETSKWKGSINDVMIFSKALDKNQVATIYNNQKTYHDL